MHHENGYIQRMRDGTDSNFPLQEFIYLIKLTVVANAIRLIWFLI